MLYTTNRLSHIDEDKQNNESVKLLDAKRKRLAAPTVPYKVDKSKQRSTLFKKYTKVGKVQQQIHILTKRKEIRTTNRITSTQNNQQESNIKSNNDIHKIINQSFDNYFPNVNKTIDIPLTSLDKSKDYLKQLKTNKIISRQSTKFQPIDDELVSAKQMRESYTITKNKQFTLKQHNKTISNVKKVNLTIGTLPKINKPSKPLQPSSDIIKTKKPIVENINKVIKLQSNVQSTVTSNIQSTIESSKDYIIPYPHGINKRDPLGLNDEPEVQRIIMKYRLCKPNLAKTTCTEHQQEMKKTTCLHCWHIKTK